VIAGDLGDGGGVAVEDVQGAVPVPLKGETGEEVEVEVVVEERNTTSSTSSVEEVVTVCEVVVVVVVVLVTAL
jgi:hypothetical protein